MKAYKITHPNIGSKAWKNQFIKALQTPSFKYTLPDIDLLPLPDSPKPNSKGKIPQYRTKAYIAEVNRVHKFNALQAFIRKAYQEHYHGNK